MDRIIFPARASTVRRVFFPHRIILTLVLPAFFFAAVTVGIFAGDAEIFPGIRDKTMPDAPSAASENQGNIDLADPFPGMPPDELGRALFPVTLPEIQAVVDALNAASAEHAKAIAADPGAGSLDDSIRAKLAELKPTPACLMTLGIMFQPMLIPMDNESVIMTNPDSPITMMLDVAPWFKHAYWLKTQTREYVQLTTNDARRYDEIFKTIDRLSPPAQRYPLTRNVILAILARTDPGLNPPRLRGRFLPQWLLYLKGCAAGNEANWLDYFQLAFTLCENSVEPALNGVKPSVDEVKSAFHLGKLSEEACAGAFLRRGATDPLSRAMLLDDMPGVSAAMDRELSELVRQVCSEGLGKGDPALATGGAVKYLEGAENFVNLLASLSGEDLDQASRRTYPDLEAKFARSCLLKACYPARGENGASLQKFLAGRNISRERLLEAAEFAPQWRQAVAECLGEKTPISGAFPDVQAEGMELRDMVERARQLPDQRKMAAFTILSNLQGNDPGPPRRYSLDSKACEYFRLLLGWKNDMALLEAFRPGSEAYVIVSALIGERNASLARRMWERTPWYNPRYTAAELGCLYIRNNIENLHAFILALTDGFTVQRFCEEQIKSAPSFSVGRITAKSKTFIGQNTFVSDLLAVLIDEEGGEKTLARVKETLQERMRLGEGRPSLRLLLEGMIKCGRPEAWDYLAKLQSEPSLPEMYRENIYDAAIRGQLDAFIAMVDACSQYNEYWSVSEAGCRWADLRDAVVDGTFWGERGLRLFSTFLKDPASACKPLKQGDNALTYFGLWALSQRSIDGALANFDNMLSGYADGSVKPEVFKVGLFWLGKVRNLTLRLRHLLPVIENRANWQDELTMALVFQCLNARSDGVQWGWKFPYTLIKNPGENRPEMADTFLVTEHELQKLKDLLKEYLDTLPDDPKRPFGGRLWVYANFNLIFFKDDVAKLLTAFDKK